MPTLFAVFLLVFPNMAIYSVATELFPAFKSGAEQPLATIGGLIDLDKRQGFCPAPRYTCEFNFCCPNTDWQCCIDGSCCQPNTYCVFASNGNIGCCQDGELCSGPVGDPSSTTSTINTTMTRFLTTIKTSPPTAPPVMTRSPTTVPSSIPTESSNTATPTVISGLVSNTFNFTPSTANNAVTQSPNQPELTPGLANNLSGATRNTGVFIANLICSFMVIATVIL